VRRRDDGASIAWALPMRQIFAAALLLLLVPVCARADSPPEDGLRWDEDRPRFRPFEYPTTALVGGAAIAMYFEVPAQREPRFVGGILFDDAVRNALRVHSPAALRTVWAASDAVDVSLVVLVFGLDSLAVPILRGSSDVALQLGLMDAEAYAFSSVLTIGLYDSVGRARPSYEDCQRNPSFVGCNISPTASFPSGHTNEAFTAAGVSCANHGFVSIYGSRFWDGLACARDVVLAASDGVLRIIGDRHYATDVLAGAAIGFSFGYGMPTLLHYAARSSSRPPIGWTLSPMTGARSGVVLSGRF
jgi:membrane-associated phospholipid phosphatase